MMSLQHASGADATFFIIDDDDIDAMALQRALRKVRIGNAICRARDGQEGLDMLRGGQVPQPWVVLLDLNMPRMGGLEFLKVIRADAAMTGTIIFVLTTSKSDEDVTSAYQDHIAGYIVKQRVGGDFQDVIGLLTHYGKLVELPLVGEIPHA